MYYRRDTQKSELNFIEKETRITHGKNQIFLKSGFSYQKYA